MNVLICSPEAAILDIGRPQLVSERSFSAKPPSLSQADVQCARGLMTGHNVLTIAYDAIEDGALSDTPSSSTMCSGARISRRWHRPCMIG